MGTAPQLDESTLEPFSERIHGRVLRPGDDGYDDARTVWNAMLDKEPAVIVRCTGAADVMSAVDFARDHEQLLAVRGGGHNVAGNAVCNDGLMIDLSPMNTVRVDPKTQTARVEPGATMADLDHETQAFGLATPGGVISTTGVAGLTLGGGHGWLDRTYGLTVDDLLSVDIVTADGELVHANEDEHPELFWAIRGGGGNFGIITSFEFALHEVEPEVLAGPIIHRYEDAAEVLRFYRDFMTDAPDEIQCWSVFIQGNPDLGVPEPLHGETLLVLASFYAGAITEGEEALQPLRDFGDPVADMVEPLPYTAWQQMFDELHPEDLRKYWRSHDFRTFSDEAIDTLVDHMDPLPTPLTELVLQWKGGAINRRSSDATAYAHRDTSCTASLITKRDGPEQDDEMIDWTQDVHDALAPHAIEGTYVNFLDEDEAERVPDAYGEHYDRLVDLKNEWDPENLFRMNQNIEPTS